MYLSPTSQHEMIQVIGKKIVLSGITEETNRLVLHTVYVD